MTEQQFIRKFKKAGFELYKTKDLKPKLDQYYANLPALKQAKKQRYEALKNALKTIEVFAIPSLTPKEFNSYLKLKQTLLKRYK